MPILTFRKLNDPSLLHQNAFVNGKWIGAKSGERFDVKGLSFVAQRQYNVKIVLNIDANIC